MFACRYHSLLAHYIVHPYVCIRNTTYTRLKHKKSLASPSLVPPIDGSLKTMNDHYNYIVKSLKLNSKFITFGHCGTTEEEEADLLVSSVCGNGIDLLGSNSLSIKTNRLKPIASYEVSVEESNLIIAFLNKRIYDKIPLPYIVGHVYSQGYRFICTNNCIIPRSYIGEILRNINAKDENSSFINTKGIHRVLDLCTGTGVLAILACKFLSNVKSVDAIDIDRNALDVAKDNVKYHKLLSKVNLMHGNLFEPINKCNSKYDLIICNPPYVNENGVRKLPAEYKHEPTIAFDGGVDGIEIILKILKDVHTYMNDDGLLLMEVGLCNEVFDEYLPDKFISSITWIDTEISDGEVFLATKKDIEILIHAASDTAAA